MIAPIVISEKINVSSREQFGNLVVPRAHNVLATQNPNEVTYSIIRNAADDTFNLEFSRRLNVVSSSGSIEYMTLPYVNINNEFEFIGLNSPISRQLLSNTQSNVWKVHRTLLKNAELRKTSSIVMGEDLFQYNFGRYDAPMGQGVIYRNINFISFDEVEKNVVANFDDIIELDSISKIDFPKVNSPTIKPSDVSVIGEDASFNEISSSPKLLYSRLFIKPIAPDFFRGNQDVAEIYGLGDNTSDWISQLEVKNAILKSSSLKSAKLNLAFEKYNGQDKLIVAGNYQPKLLGKLKITDPTYYDYVAAETKVGFAPHSIIGEIIPYSFKGDYTREIDIDFNGVFQNMKLAFTRRVTQPVLGVTNGIVKLSLYPNENRPSSLMGYFNPEDIKFIKNNELDLNGLMRLAKREQ